MSDERVQCLEGLNVAELSVPDCTLAMLVRRSQDDFEIDFFERILIRDPDNVDVLRALADLFAAKRWHRRALQVDLRLAELRPADPLVQYNLACSHSLAGQVFDALAALRLAFRHGFSDFESLDTDPDFDVLRSRPEFVALVQSARTGQLDPLSASAGDSPSVG